MGESRKKIDTRVSKLWFSGDEQMISYCISCKKDVEYLVFHLMTDEHKKNTIKFCKKLKKNVSN